MTCQTVGPRDLKIGMHMQLDPESNLVNVRTQVGKPEDAVAENWIFASLSELPSFKGNHRVEIQTTQVI